MIISGGHNRLEFTRHMLLISTNFANDFLFYNSLAITLSVLDVATKDKSKRRESLIYMVFPTHPPLPDKTKEKLFAGWDGRGHYPTIGCAVFMYHYIMDILITYVVL